MINSSYKVIHILNGDDKFTIGYIEFFKKYFKDIDLKFFIILNKYCHLQFKDEQSIVLLKQLNCINQRKIVDELEKADKIIISGIFGIENTIVKFSKKILTKTYLQFWGGDFYCYKNLKPTNIKNIKKLIIDKPNLSKCIKNCAGVINLIDSDWIEFYKIFPYDNVKHFTAPMPGDPNKVVNYDEYRKKHKNMLKNSIRILVGNSATSTNHHIETFEMLKVFKDENIEIVSPLSYGDDGYKQLVIAEGKKILGDKFIPIETFMEKEKYIEFLNSCDIAIFNNDRQQAMGNITIMLSLGKKVYVRPNTSMWKHYNSFGITLYDINLIHDSSFKELIYQNDDVIRNNMSCADNLQNTDRKVMLWWEVFND